jgi:hypothetical protein
LGAYSLENKCKQNINFVECCIKCGKSDYEPLAGRLYYSVFQKVKSVMYSWYLSRKMKGAESESKFFKHDELDRKLTEYVSGKNISIKDEELGLIISIKDKLWKMRVRADYHQYSTPIIKNEIDECLKDAKNINTLISSIFER